MEEKNNITSLHTHNFKDSSILKLAESTMGLDSRFGALNPAIGSLRLPYFVVSKDGN